ncbi:Isochorismatase family protein yecD [Actinomyces bovis]|uniref:Isochorismatase family protein yecD n=1 Tax=Actinomyces bovis TaxID=1658 RepID=A0ABY1VL47_9ACTO|nr:isochorismatase family cysteine hydrolase [Actinomyces bovis]SPT52811.1 Isochorismatase family protein yecD [Actinomyces bovis]VEG54860.1 Isochorismatase family protein yecD [Actinomyces israelii]
MALPKPQPTPWQNSTELDLERAALIVVDVLGGCNGVPENLQEMADNSVRLAKAARSAGVPVIFTDDNHIPDTDLEFTLWGAHSVRGTEDSKPLDAFAVTDADYVIPKRRYSAFFSTDLDITLRELGRDTLIVVGADTNICVLHTLASAYYLGYRTIVPADATATFLVGTQEDGLAYFSRVFDTRVVTTDDVVTALS